MTPTPNLHRHPYAMLRLTAAVTTYLVAIALHIVFSRNIPLKLWHSDHPSMMRPSFHSFGIWQESHIF
jgi:hypothetical protein